MGDHRDIPPFGRKFFDSGAACARIGEGAVGGKARGLLAICERIAAGFGTGAFPGLSIDVPRFLVLTTDVFDAFVHHNRLDLDRLAGEPDDRIVHAFQQGDLPTRVLGDVKALVDGVHTPLAVRSSSLLEDSLERPFAGVYGTKMTPNNQPDAESRFHRLIEAIKFVYASTYFKGARSYLATLPGEGKTGCGEPEKMAVVIQEIVGGRHGDRFYPDVSGVGRSYNFYPFGSSRPEEGVVDLALGLGKTIVDGGTVWSYSPAHPQAPPPFGSVADRLHNTQLTFWAVNMGQPPDFDPTLETEYLVRCGLAEAEYDGTLARAASTYVADSDRLVPGIGRAGPRVIDFAPLLSRDEPFSEAVASLLRVGEEVLDADVEIEFALAFAGHREPRVGRLGVVQVRPMLVSDDEVVLQDTDMSAPGVLVATDHAMGNGIIDTIRDIVYVKPDSFETTLTARVAAELEEMNDRLRRAGRPYLLIGFGRWGSSDPSLGIPVSWGQISGAHVIVEATLPHMNVDPSQGSHFFHNLTSFRVAYLMVRHGRKPGIAWAWLSGQPATAETELVRHLELARPLLVKVDGRTGRAIVSRSEAR